MNQLEPGPVLVRQGNASEQSMLKGTPVLLRGKKTKELTTYSQCSLYTQNSHN